MGNYDSKKVMIPTFPDFFVIGAAKSGTTSLYHYLDQHPDVYMSPIKEPHWFSRVPYVPARGPHPVSSEEEYLKLFRRRRGESAAGEASTSYIWDEEAPHRIKETVPRARIVAILRQPVERAYSHYLMDVRAGKQDLPFMQALSQDLQTEHKEWGTAGQYVGLGFYGRQLRRYFGVFQKTRIKVFLYEDLQKDAQGLIESLLEFLEVEPSDAPYIRTDLLHNRFSVPRNQLAQEIFRSRIFRAKRSSALRTLMIPNNQTRSRVREKLLFREAAKPQMDREAASFLAKLYQEDIQQLQGLLDRDLGHWLRTA